MQIGVGAFSTSMSGLLVMPISLMTTVVVGFHDLKFLDKTEIATELECQHDVLFEKEGATDKTIDEQCTDLHLNS